MLSSRGCRILSVTSPVRFASRRSSLLCLRSSGLPFPHQLLPKATMTVQALAVVQRNKPNGSVLVQEQTQLPELEEHQVLVKIVNAALNPTDGELL